MTGCTQRLFEKTYFSMTHPTYMALAVGGLGTVAGLRDLKAAALALLVSGMVANFAFFSFSIKDTTTKAAIFFIIQLPVGTWVGKKVDPNFNYMPVWILSGAVHLVGASAMCSLSQ